MNNYIKIIFFFLSFIVFSCNKNNEQSGWTDTNKKEYQSSCIEFSKASFENDESKTSIYCDCVLNKVMSRYPNYSAVLRMTPAEREKYYYICK